MASHSCVNCGNPYTPYRSWQRYCTPACRAQYYERYVRHSCADALKVLDGEVGEEVNTEKIAPSESVIIS